MGSLTRCTLWALPFALACSPPRPPIVFSEITDGRVPTITQTAFLDPPPIAEAQNRGWAGPGAAIADVDGDGRPDVFFAGGGLFYNRPDPAGFRLEPAAVPLPPIPFAPIGVSFADFDRDGDLDLTLCGDGGVVLLRNDGGGVFTDVTAAAGVAGAPTDLSISVAWGDLDGDGWLDLSVGNYGIIWDPVNDQQLSRVWLNRRDGTFSALGQPTITRRSVVTVMADFDGDGQLDVYFGDDNGVSYLNGKFRHDLVLLNRGLDANGALQLVESSAALGLDDARATMSCAFGDARPASGWNLFFSDIGAAWLYQSSGAAHFSDATMASGIALTGTVSMPWIMWGAAFADLDGDGLEEVLVAQAPIHQMQDGTADFGPMLLENRGGKFELKRYAFGGPMPVRALLLADLDGDGDDDVVATPYFDRFRVFSNDTQKRNAVRVTLAPTVSAPGAIGALLVVSKDGVVQRRMRVSGGQPSSESDGVLDVALGGETKADLTVTWPSGAITTSAGAAAGSTTLHEPQWITISDAHPPADGATQVTAVVDAGLAGLGHAGSTVHWAAAGVALDAVCDASGAATLQLPPRATAGAVQATITVDGRVLPAHPAIDYR